MNTGRAFRGNKLKSFPTALTSHRRKFIAFSLALAVINLSAGVSLGGPSRSAMSLATLRVSGEVTVNKLRALSGQTILPNSSIVTARSSNSTLELGNFTRLVLSEQTEFTVDFSTAGVAGSLGKGELRAFMPAARTFRVTTPHGVLETDASQPAVFSVDVQTGFTQISVEAGRVELRIDKTSRVLAAGETFVTDCGDLALSPSPHQSLDNSGKVGIIAGIGVGVASLITAITGKNPKEVLDFGGCVVVSDIIAGPGMCG